MSHPRGTEEMQKMEYTDLLNYNLMMLRGEVTVTNELVDYMVHEMNYRCMKIFTSVNKIIDNMNLMMTENEVMKKTIHDIAPWLSASLSDPGCAPCKEYTDACNAIFEIDKRIS